MSTDIKVKEEEVCKSPHSPSASSKKRKAICGEQAVAKRIRNRAAAKQYRVRKRSFLNALQDQNQLLIGTILPRLDLITKLLQQPKTTSDLFTLPFCENREIHVSEYSSEGSDMSSPAPLAEFLPPREEL